MPPPVPRCPPPPKRAENPGMEYNGITWVFMGVNGDSTVKTVKIEGIQSFGTIPTEPLHVDIQSSQVADFGSAK